MSETDEREYWLGHGGGLDADKIDGMHAETLVYKAQMYGGGGPEAGLPCSYLISQRGNNFIAINGSTGKIDYSGTDDSTVIQAASNALTTGGTIFLKEIKKPFGITIPTNVRLTEHYQGRERVYLWSGLAFSTLGVRVGPLALVYFDSDGYYVVRMNAAITGEVYASVWTIGQLFHFGSYQATVKIANPGANRGFHVFGFEKHHGWASEGLITMECDEGTYRATSKIPSGTEATVLTDCDWTTDTILKIVWASDSIKFYVNGLLKATHTSRIPQEPMSWYLEAFTFPTAPGVEFSIKQKNFEEIP